MNENSKIFDIFQGLTMKLLSGHTTITIAKKSDKFTYLKVVAGSTQKLVHIFFFLLLITANYF